MKKFLIAAYFAVIIFCICSCGKESTGNLAGDGILSVSADKQGNVWEGTNAGLCKYDGIKWTTFFGRYS